jgi:hypothetical protein
MQTIDIEKVVSAFPRESEWGFTEEELIQLIKLFPKVTKAKFNDAMGCNTCMIVNGKIRNYPCDVISALACVLQNREKTLAEFD